jgi:hypothetical protein
MQDIKLSVKDITTLVPYAKTITSPTLSKPNISSSGPSVTYDHKTSSLVSLLYGLEPSFQTLIVMTMRLDLRESNFHQLLIISIVKSGSSV